MKESETTSWIFLSIALGSEKSSVDFKNIIMIADGINHAIPTYNEMQSSIKFLLNKGYIANNQNRFSLTETGKRIYDKERSTNKSMLTIWKNLTKYVT